VFRVHARVQSASAHAAQELAALVPRAAPATLALQLDDSVIQGFATLFWNRLPELERVVELVQHGRFRRKFLNSQFQWLKKPLSQIVLVQNLLFGISDKSYASILRPLLRPIADHTRVPLAPALATLRRERADLFTEDPAGIFRTVAAGADDGKGSGGRYISVKATITAQLAMKSIRSALGPLDNELNKLVIAAHVDHRRLTKKLDQTIYGCQFLNAECSCRC
jgi:hypothetical protein